MRVLILEDEPDGRETLVRLFRAYGHNPLGCDNGWHGLFLLATQDWDGMVTDLVLPALSGWDVIREMDEHLPHRKVPVIVVSGYAWVCPPHMDHDIPVVVKPYDPVELIRMCEQNFKK